jgi:hypothetical protein
MLRVRTCGGPVANTAINLTVPCKEGKFVEAERLLASQR